MLNGNEIIGFAAPDTRFDLIEALHRVRGVEIARIADIAGRLSQRFGPEIVVGFLHCEILGRPADGKNCADHVERLRRMPSSVGALAEELLALADAEPAGGAGRLGWAEQNDS